MENVKYVLKYKKDSEKEIIVIPNKFLESLLKTTNNKQQIIDDVFKNFLLANGENEINIDIADIDMLINGKDKIFVGLSKNGNSITNSINSVKDFNQPLTDARSVLVHFTLHPNYPIMEVYEAMQSINDSVHEDADVLFGTTSDSSLDEDYIEVSLLLSM